MTGALMTGALMTGPLMTGPLMTGRRRSAPAAPAATRGARPRTPFEQLVEAGPHHPALRDGLLGAVGEQVGAHAVEQAAHHGEPARGDVPQLRGQPASFEVASPGEAPPGVLQLRAELGGLPHPLP